MSIGHNFLNYLSATGLQLGLLVNFGHCPKLQYERFANTKDASSGLPNVAMRAKRGERENEDLD
jgi:hypothetical protein